MVFETLTCLIFKFSVQCSTLNVSTTYNVWVFTNKFHCSNKPTFATSYLSFFGWFGFWIRPLLIQHMRLSCGPGKLMTIKMIKMTMMMMLVSQRWTGMYGLVRFQRAWALTTCARQPHQFHLSTHHRHRHHHQHYVCLILSMPTSLPIQNHLLNIWKISRYLETCGETWKTLIGNRWAPSESRWR